MSKPSISVPAYEGKEVVALKNVRVDVAVQVGGSGMPTNHLDSGRYMLALRGNWITAVDRTSGAIAYIPQSNVVFATPE